MVTNIQLQLLVFKSTLKLYNSLLLLMQLGDHPLIQFVLLLYLVFEALYLFLHLGELSVEVIHHDLGSFSAYHPVFVG